MHIVIIDTDSLARDGLCALLRAEPAWRLLGAFEAVQAATRAALANPPDVAIVDVTMANPTGVDSIEALRERWPCVRILVLAQESADRALKETLGTGADGYLLRSDKRQELANALQSVGSGQRYISSSIIDLIVRAEARKPAVAREQSDGLSDRERDVLRRIALGQRTRQIANELSLSHKTIEKHRGSLMRKLGLKTATAVAAYAIAHGYLDT